MSGAKQKTLLHNKAGGKGNAVRLKGRRDEATQRDTRRHCAAGIKTLRAPGTPHAAPEGGKGDTTAARRQHSEHNDKEHETVNIKRQKTHTNKISQYFFLIQTERIEKKNERLKKIRTKKNIEKN